jgi:hypothetical protein
MVLEFQRAAHHHLSHSPADNEYLDWLALMQHYGGPTRLLDFTHSFFVAAFFAMEEWPQPEEEEKNKGRVKPGAVWAINLSVLHECAKKNPEISKIEMRLDSPQRVERVNALITENFEGKKNAPFVLAVEPHRLDARLIAQQGLFLFPCDLSASFYDNLTATLGLRQGYFFDTAPEPWTETLVKDCHDGKIAVLKLLLPSAEPHTNYGEAYAIMRDLREMNITAATLFPGLDGFARSMSCHLRHVNERPPT